MINAMGFVTAGGRSSRMGRDKAWLEIGGRPLIQHVIDVITPVTTSVALIANDPSFERLHLPVFADQTTGVGPLEAIRTALANSTEPLVVLAGCDLPFLSSELFSILLEKVVGFEAAVPVSENDILEPLCAVYSTEALDAVTDCVAHGIRKVSDFLDRIPVRLVQFDEIQKLKGSSLFFYNVNTPQDYALAIEKASGPSPI
jgi:molybdenum cofactor guanylyltransferase